MTTNHTSIPTSIPNIQNKLLYYLTHIISETNGIALADTLKLLENWLYLDHKNQLLHLVKEFNELLGKFQQNKCDISTLLNHVVSKSLFLFFKNFPLKFYDEHIHLSGSLHPHFVFPKLAKLLTGPNKNIYQAKIKNIYGIDNITNQQSTIVIIHIVINITT